MSSSVEKRFALAEVSNASRAPRRAHAVHADGHHIGHAEVEIHDDAPPRDFIAFVESGVCGRDHEGRTVVVVNEHARRRISVTVEQVLKVDGRPRTRTLRHLRLDPGDEKELGCGRDGNATWEFELLEARL